MCWDWNVEECEVKTFRNSIRLGRLQGVSRDRVFMTRVLEQSKKNTLHLCGEPNWLSDWKKKRTMLKRQKQKEKLLRKLERRRL